VHILLPAGHRCFIKQDATGIIVRWITGVAVESGHDIPEEVMEAELHPEE
jgi:hypothetical protein